MPKQMMRLFTILFQIPSWITLLANFVVLNYFLRQLKEHKRTSDNPISRKLVHLFVITIIASILYSTAIIIRLSICDPATCSPSGGFRTFILLTDFFRGNTILIIFVAQNTFYLYRLKACFETSIYAVSNRTIYTSLFAMSVGSCSLFAGWITFLHHGFERRITLIICVVTGGIITEAVAIRIAYHFLHKLLLLIGADGHRTSVYHLSQVSNNKLKIVSTSSYDNRTSNHEKKDKDKHKNNNRETHKNKDGTRNNNNNNTNNNNNKNCSNDNNNNNTNNTEASIPSSGSPTVSATFCDVMEKSTDIVLTDRQQLLVKTINKQTLLVLASVIPMLISLLLKVLILLVTPDDYFDSDGFNPVGVLFFMIEPFILFNTVANIWLSFIFAQKNYYAICHCIDDNCAEMWEKAARYAIAKNVLKDAQLNKHKFEGQASSSE